MSDDLLLSKAFYNQKRGKGSAYNYDIAPLIENFSFYEFITEAERNKLSEEDHGGFVVITPKQYIVGYNAGFGAGTHLSSFSRAMRDIKGGGSINNIQDAIKLNEECFDKYITATIVYEEKSKDNNGKPFYTGYIDFDLGNTKISEQMYESFLKFYDDYNDDISYTTMKYGNKFSVVFKYRDKDGKLDMSVTDNLDTIKYYLKSRIDYEKQDDYDETIIGKQTISKGIR